VKAETESSSAPNPEEPSKTSRIPRWVGAIAAIALIVGIVGVILFYGYQARPGWVGVANKKFWDYLELLIVPAALAIGVYLLNRAQQERERRVEEARGERELEVENQRAQDEALQAYLDQMSQLLIDKERPLHRSQRGDSLSTVARARTLTVLPRLEGERKGSVLQFLVESNLITKNRLILKLKGADLSGAYLRGATLGGADLSGVDLSRADLSGANLSYADLSYANLSNTNLEDTDLWGAKLEHADLSEAHLTSAILQGADLTEAILNKANLQAVDMTEAILYKANLQAVDMTEAKPNLYVGGETSPHAAYLFGAYMDEANLAGANLSGVAIDPRILMDLATSLEGAIMPNGLKYKNWLKTSEGQLSITKGATTWLKTSEGQRWLNEGIKDGVPRDGKKRKYLDWLKTPEGQNWLKTYKGDDAEV
jgi:uncharacterized protein YjbI with pentapeptide repeats